MKEDKREQGAWWLIIGMFIIFWPVGVFLLIKKLNEDKKTSFSSGGKMTTWGWIIVVIGFFAIIGSSGKAFFFLLAGIALIYIGKKTKAKAKNYKMYIDLIVNRQVRSIVTISSTLGVPHEVVRRDLQAMIEKGYFEHAYIDRDKIVLPDINIKYTSPNHPIEMVIVPCGGCGANNKVQKGRVEHCQYCSSYIGA